MIWLYIIIGVIVVTVVAWFVRHQRRLRTRAHLMQEAIRNRDFTFRLPTDGLLPGERAMQETMNMLGDTVRQQVNKSEVESWERLTRVLTHEMMNAIAPIASISQSLLCRPDVKGTPLEEGIQAIHNTSHHLSTFVESYRKLSQLQQPNIQNVSLPAVIQDVVRLFPTIQWECSLSGDSIAIADPIMLHQVLLNLVKNAIEAGAHCISIDPLPPHSTGGGFTGLYISNDGQPIPAEDCQSIFVPFFTTKRTGTGIGLSLSRRMMIQQGGCLELADRPLMGFHTTFVLQFPAA